MFQMEDMVFTKQQLETYVHFEGDVDMYSRLAGKLNPSEKIEESDFYVIDDLVQRLKIRNNKSESSNYKNETDKLLKKYIQTEEGLCLLLEYCLNEGNKKAWWKFW